MRERRQRVGIIDISANVGVENDLLGIRQRCDQQEEREGGSAWRPSIGSDKRSMRGVADLQCHGTDERFLEDEAQGMHECGLIETGNGDGFAERSAGGQRR